MRKLSFLVAAAFALGLAPLSQKLGPVVGSVASIALAIALACTASGTVSALAMAGGALGAFGAGVLGSTSSAVAGACLVGLAFAERTIRVRTPAARALHLGVAAVGGALAGMLSAAYASSSIAVEGVSLLVGSVLVALPLLVDADDPIAYALEETAGRVPIPAARWLREGAALRRHVDDDRLEAATRRDVAKTWLALLQLAEARRRLDRIRQVHVTGLRVDESNERTPSAAETVVMMLDEKIHRHVAALTRAYTAIDTAKAAEVGLDDTAAQGVDAAGETLEDVSRAIVDVRA